MKKVLKILLISCLFIGISNINADTLKELKDQLAKDEAEKASIIERQKNIQKNIASAKNEISGLEADIEKYEEEIDATLKEIDELNIKIDEKNKEIDNLVSFLQVSNGDNVYLEYVFQAKSFTDFIYRSAIVEQLSKYNDELIDEMQDMIEENKQLEKDLQQKITSSENTINELDKKLSNYNVSIKDLQNAHTDIEEEIADRKKTIAYYESVYKENGCKETEEMTACLTHGISSSGFVRPTTKGTISSEWGYRTCPIHGKELHSGIDIAVSMGTPVYAASAGIVVGITRKSSCGGNIVTVLHNIKGTSYRTRYMHLSSISVSMGDYVSINTEIGKSGGGGYTLKKNGGWDTCSTGAHLHFMVMKGSDGSTTLNPRNFVKFPAKNGSFSSRW